MALIDFYLSNSRRIYSSMGNPLGVKGLTTWKAKNYGLGCCFGLLVGFGRGPLNIFCIPCHISDMKSACL